MIEVKDQMGSKVRLEKIPGRIICLVPSITELLYDLGLENEVVGITKFCVHPEEWFRSKKRIGGTKNLDIEMIRVLHPQLIIANKEENVKEQVESIQSFCPVYTSNIKTLDDALQMITDIGILSGRLEQAGSICSGIIEAFSQLSKIEPPLECCYLVWKDPYMAAGGDTFINDMLLRCGFQNVFRFLNRYPRVELKDIINSGSKWVLLSSEPFPFRDKHVNQIYAEPALKNCRVILVDGEMFSWYGSRLRHAAAYFYKLQMFAIAERDNFCQ